MSPRGPLGVARPPLRNTAVEEWTLRLVLVLFKLFLNLCGRGCFIVLISTCRCWSRAVSSTKPTWTTSSITSTSSSGRWRTTLPRSCINITSRSASLCLHVAASCFSACVSHDFCHVTPTSPPAFAIVDVQPRRFLHLHVFPSCVAVCGAAPELVPAQQHGV